MGLRATALQFDPATEAPAELLLPHPPRQVAVNGIARTIWYLDNEHPEWRKRNYRIEHEWEVWEGTHYDADAVLVGEVDALYIGQEQADPAKRMADFLRVHQNNPLASANLIKTLVGMHRKPQEGWNDRGTRVSQMSMELSTRGIAQTIWYIAASFPEWPEEDHLIESSSLEYANGQHYYCSERMGRIPTMLLSRQPDLTAPIEHELITAG